MADNYLERRMEDYEVRKAEWERRKRLGISKRKNNGEISTSDVNEMGNSQTSKEDFAIFIPARYASTRFPGKPLAMIGGKMMIERVYERAKEVIDEVYVATDDERISSAVESFGGKYVMTSPNHRSGTDRIREAYEKSGCKKTIIINIQGDEPFVRPEQIETLCSLFDTPDTQIGTLVKQFTPSDGLESLENPNSPKVVVSPKGLAVYFSRSVIPYLRGVDKNEWLSRHKFYKHLGLYAYRAEVLDAITKLPQSDNEATESLEQLRWIDNGYKIRVGETDTQTIGIDTPEDLERAELFLSELSKQV